jgi:hypothetical protein
MKLVKWKHQVIKNQKTGPHTSLSGYFFSPIIQHNWVSSPLASALRDVSDKTVPLRDDAFAVKTSNIEQLSVRFLGQCAINSTVPEVQ